MTNLSVNLNRVALLRNSRNIGIPNVITSARIVLEAGAYGITVHPRPDQRHIRPDNVDDLAKLLANEFNGAEYNIEGNPFQPPFMEIVCRVKPTQCTLVPDLPDAFTSDQVWNIAKEGERLFPSFNNSKRIKSVSAFYGCCSKSNGTG